MKTIIVNNKMLNDKAILFHIDEPGSNSIYSDVFVFSGWAFSTDGDDVSVEIECDNVTDRQVLNVLRNDVVVHFTKGSNAFVPPLKCGFKFSLKKDAKIVIYCGETATMEITFLVFDATNDAELILLEKLNNAHLYKDHGILNANDIELLNNIPYKYVENNAHELSKAYWIPIDTRENIKIFIENASSLDFGPKVVESALSNGIVKIASPLHANTDAFCDCSFYTAPFNYLRFTSNSDVFYIIQHFSFCDAIYIPKLGFHHFLSVWIDKEQYYKHIERITLTSEQRKGPFNSVFVAHNRPYHYNYDMALGLHLLEINSLLEKTPLIALHEEKCFFQPSKLINKKIKEIIFNDRDFSAHLNQSGFSILAGHQNFNSAKESTYRTLFADLDLNLRTNSELVLKSEVLSKICEGIDECDVKLWFGITSQKRKLINQEEEIARTINIFSDIFDSVGVVIDGWTSPFLKSENDILQIANDSLVAGSIHKLVNAENVSFYSAIGLTTEEKLVITKYIDVFLANHGAGSMHIDRMGNRFGVTHNSNIWSAADFVHIHNNSISISQDNISDFEPIGKAQDYVDYSVVPKVIARNMLLQYFNSINQDAR